MLKAMLAVALLAASPQADMFKKESASLQQDVNTVVTPIAARFLQQSKATYLEGYGIVVTLEVALAPSRNPFSGATTTAEIQAAVGKSRRDLMLKMTAFVTQKVATLQSLAPSESLAVVVHILNTNPADVPDLPSQIVFVVKKGSPGQVVSREF